MPRLRWTPQLRWTLPPQWNRLLLPRPNQPRLSQLRKLQPPQPQLLLKLPLPQQPRKLLSSFARCGNAARIPIEYIQGM
jgi:hypothetical protein